MLREEAGEGCCAFMIAGDDGSEGTFSSFKRWIVVTAVMLLAGVVAWRYSPSSRDRFLTSIRVSPSHQRVAFVMVRGDGTNLDVVSNQLRYAANRFGLELPWERIDTPLCLTSATGQAVVKTEHHTCISAFNIDWSPDDRSIAYVSVEIGYPEYKSLFEYDYLDGTVEKIATVPGFVMRSPRYSPCGRYVAFVHDYDRGVLSIVDRQTGNTKELAEDVGWSGRLCWNADATIIYCISRSRLMAVPVGGGEPEVVTTFETTPDAYPCRLTASPYRKRIGYTFGESFQTVDLDTGQRTDHFDFFGCSLDQFDWSESGVCYVEALCRPRYLMVNRLDGRPSQIIACGPLTEPKWISDDKILVRYDHTELWTYSVSMGESKRLYP